MSKKYVIIDLDGTLCNVNHRKTILWMHGKQKYDWLCMNDIIYDDVTHYLNNCNHIPVFFTERYYSEIDKTIEWFKRNESWFYNVPTIKKFDQDFLYMRHDNDTDSSPVFKSKLIDQFRSDMSIEMSDIFCALDDDQSCVDMYNMRGITSYKVR